MKKIIVNLLLVTLGLLLCVKSFNAIVLNSMSVLLYLAGVLFAAYGILSLLNILIENEKLNALNEDKALKPGFNVEKKKYNAKYFTKNFNSPEKDCIKSFELLRRVYNLIEMSHLNDGKLNKTYRKSVDFPRSLGDHIFNLLSAKDQIFRETAIRRQKRYRNRIKRLNHIKK